VGGDFPLTADAFAAFVAGTGSLPKQDRADVFAAVLSKGVTLDEAKKLVGIREFDETALRAAVQAAVAANPKAVADFKGGKDAAKMSILGAVMKANKGAPNDTVRKLLDEELAKA
jgi:aspartyl-tRNA(Asn)/glutamyl-tRNA(Gln) amidotransferase subunit B